jgi:Gpi18-like mannosyltransferase
MTKEIALLFGIAVAVRGILSLSQIIYGQQGFPGLPLSTWNDFYTTYTLWLGYVQHGLLPYRDFPVYKYTPLFLYGLYPFYAAGGAAAAAIPIVVSDAATAVVVYLIVGRFAKTKIAFAAGLTYAFSPFVLNYEGYLWLSSQPMTLLILLAIYLLNANKPTFSIGVLAVAVMFKQEALFILPAYLVLYAMEYTRGVLKGIGLFVAIVVVLSLPFLILAPRAYLYSVNYFPIGQIINLGPWEKSLPISSGIVNTAVSMPNPLGTCEMTTFPGLYTGTLCGGVHNLQAFASSLILGTLNQIASFLAPLLLVLFASAALVIRRAPNFAQIMCAYSCLGLLLAFSKLIEPALAYYFVPVYALVFASVRDARTLAVGGATAILSATIPEGPFQFILPLASLFLITIIQDVSWRTQDGAAVSLAEGRKI